MEPRPTIHSTAVQRAACEALLPDVQNWSSRRPIEIEMLVRCASLDGYEFARALEDRCGIFPNFELAEILDGYHARACRARDNALMAWVSAHRVTVPFDLNQRVVHRRYGPGKVNDVRDATAEVIFVPDAEADRYAKMDCACGLIVAAEDLRAEEESPAGATAGDGSDVAAAAGAECAP